MAGRNDRTRVQAATRTRPSGARQPSRPAGQVSTATTTRRRASVPLGRPGMRPGSNLPIDIHRMLASAGLVLLLIVTLIPTSAPAAPDPTVFLTPNASGAGSVPEALSGEDIENAIFPYLTTIERSQGNISSAWPAIADVLAFDPNSLRARSAIIGQLYAETTGNLNRTIKDTGLEINPAPDKLAGIEDAYKTLLSNQEKEGHGYNGLASMLLLRSLTAPREQREVYERDAISGFRGAINSNPDAWQFTYNWALANFLSGNYTAAQEGFRTVRDKALGENNPLLAFWAGASALRQGNAFDAIRYFDVTIKQEPPEGANVEYARLIVEGRDLAREGLGDAQWAFGNPAAAYGTYFNTLLDGRGTSGLYAKWLRLGIQQRAYTGMVDDLATLARTFRSSTTVGRETVARYLHDRARLLSLLGRGDAAMSAYREALEFGGNDPALLVSYGQALESRGNHDEAHLRATEAIRTLGFNPTAPDLTTVARSVVTVTTPLLDVKNAQAYLDANLLRARAFGQQGNAEGVNGVDALVANIIAPAVPPSPHEAGLLQMYGAFAYEEAGNAAKAAERYAAAWDALKDLPSGSAGRAASLAGLARTTAAAGDPQAGIDLLKANGYDPASPPQTTSTDTDAPLILSQGSILLDQAGQQAQAANARRVAAVARNIQDVRKLTGAGRPIWSANGTFVPVSSVLDAADYTRRVASDRIDLAVLRYKEAATLDPALAPAWNNLGVLYARMNNPDAAGRYLSDQWGKVSPGYAVGLHNGASLAYTQGPSGFFEAEAAQGAAIKAQGSEALRWSYGLNYDERGPVPAPAGRGGDDLLSKLPALLIVALLLAHTLVGNDRMTNRMGLLPTRGILGKAALAIDERARRIAPGLVTARGGRNALPAVVGIPALVGMFGLAWAAAQGSLGVFLMYLPVALLLALVAFGANELAQQLVARRNRAETVHHIWPLGVVLGVLSIPFGFVYGWQNVTRVQPERSESTGATRSAAGRHTRTVEEAELEYEAQVEAAAESGGDGTATAVLAPPARSGGRLGLNTAASIMLAGLVANLVLGALFGVIYWLTGWPSMRLGMFASMLVLAFTAVSEPPADGWTLFRRNSPLWLAIFIFAATMATLLAARII